MDPLQVLVLSQELPVLCLEGIVVILLRYEVVGGVQLLLQTVVVDLQGLNQFLWGEYFLAQLLELGLQQGLYLRLGLLEFCFEALQLMLQVGFSKGLDVFGVRSELNLLQKHYLLVQRLLLLLQSPALHRCLPEGLFQDLVGGQETLVGVFKQTVFLH